MTPDKIFTNLFTTARVVVDVVMTMGLGLEGNWIWAVVFGLMGLAEILVVLETDKT